jgi:hypothetical protein
MPPREKGRRGDPIPKDILCQDFSETNSQLVKPQFLAFAVEPLFYWVLA